MNRDRLPRSTDPGPSRIGLQPDAARPDRTGLAWLVAALLFALPCGCAEAAPVSVHDDTGRLVTLAAPARRIVSLAPHLTELLFAAGAGQRIVGVVDYSDFPPAAQGIERVGDSARLDLERIAMLAPDLVVAWDSGNPALQVQRLRALGVPVYASEPRRLADVASTLRRLGVLAATGTTAEARATAFEGEIAALRTRYAQRRELRVFHQIWSRPLMTVNGKHMVSEVLQLCGARNVFAGLGPLTPTVSREAVVAQDPDVILATTGDTSEPARLSAWQRLPGLRAVRSGNLLVLDADTLHRSTDRIITGAREVCEKLDAARQRLVR